MSIEIVRKQVRRDDYFIQAAQNKKVLDIGCVAADGLMNLHTRMKCVSNSITGLDLQSAEGVVQGDAQCFDFGDEKFDVCVAGEVIEHLGNISGFLKCCAKSVGINGRLIITTPNAYSLVALRLAMFGKVVPNDLGHVLQFDAVTFRNMLVNYAPNNGFSGQVFYYEDSGDVSNIYRLNRAISKRCPGYSCGLIADLTVNPY